MNVHDTTRALEMASNTNTLEAVNGSGAAREETRGLIVYEKPRPKLHTIFACDPVYNEHRVMLEDWTKQLEASERSLARKQASGSSARADLYQILGLFFVFQGVVITAAAQSNLLKCNNWYLPFMLSLIVSVAAFAAAIQKLKEEADFKKQSRLEKAVHRSIYNSLDKLRQDGVHMDLQLGQPELQGPYTESEIRGKGHFDKVWATMSRFSSVWVCSYAGAVLVLLLLQLQICVPGQQIRSNRFDFL